VSNTFRNLGFYSENVSQFPVITLRPQMGVRVGSDQLHVDVHPIAGLLDASFEHIARSEERRVGKECRFRGRRDHSKKNKQRVANNMDLESDNCHTTYQILAQSILACAYAPIP